MGQESGRSGRSAVGFPMWLEGKAGDLTALFTPDVQYIESWGPEYRGVSQVRHWFQEWTPAGGSWSGNFGASCTTGTALWRSGTSKIRWMAGWRNLTGSP